MMPPGKYYVGDLCYVMHPQWDEVCNITFSGQNSLEGEFKLENGVTFAMYSTAHGDGSYRDGAGKEYGVDSGTIGCIRVEDIADPEATDLERAGVIHEFAHPFRTWSDGSVLHFGDVAIDTDDYSEEEEEEEEDEEEEA